MAANRARFRCCGTTPWVQPKYYLCADCKSACPWLTSGCLVAWPFPMTHVIVIGQVLFASWHQLAAWSSGTILASGARGPRFNSRSGPAHSLVGWRFAALCLVDPKSRWLHNAEPPVCPRGRSRGWTQDPLQVTERGFEPHSWHLQCLSVCVDDGLPNWQRFEVPI